MRLYLLNNSTAQQINFQNHEKKHYKESNDGDYAICNLAFIAARHGGISW